MSKPFITAHLGLLLLALPIPLLLFPAQTPIGGVPGLAALLFFLTGWPPGLIVFLLNIFCLVVAFFTVGPKHTLQSIYASLLLALLIEGIYRLFPLPVVVHPLWPWVMQAGASLSMGAGLFLLVWARYAPAGTAILSVILNRWTKLPVLFWLILFDICIALATALFMDLTTALRTAFGMTLMYLAYAFAQKKLMKANQSTRDFTLS